MLAALITSLKIFGPPTFCAVIFYCVWQGPRSGWTISAKRLKNSLTNVGFAIVNLGLNSLLVMALAILSVKALDTSALPHISDAFWDGLPVLAAIAAALVVLDFTNYVAHRILHTKFFWGIHAVHHSDSDITWTTAYRIHILEGFVMGACVFVLIGWLNLPVAAVGTVFLIRTWYIFYTHTQSGFDHGILKKLLVSPNYHRWHHANDVQAYDKNLADMFPVWDILFGTYYNPGPCEAELGLGPDVPTDLVLSQSYPFKYWAYMAKDKFTRKAEKTALPS